MTTPASAIPIEVLLVEDDPADARLTREALREAKVNSMVHVVQDGAAALSYLRGEPPHADAVRPDLILLDLNLPKKNGREVLAEIKADPGLRQIPVVILTTSDAERDIVQSYDLHANAYVQKPLDLDQFLHVVHSIDDFYLTVVRLPPR